MPTQKKIDTVNALSEKLSRAKSVVFADYRGLTHKQMEELRKSLKKLSADFTVAKNRLMMRALGKDIQLTDTTATLFSYADEIAPLKELVKFFKATGVGRLKSGLLSDRVLSEAETVRLAALPPRNALLAQLTGQLNAPIQGLHYALSWNIKKLLYVLGQIQRS